MVEYFDEHGRLRWTKDGEGYVNYFAHHPEMGGLAYRAVDVDPASMVSEATAGSAGNWDAWTVGDADGNKPTRGSGLPAVLNLVTKTYYDVYGRDRRTIEPGGAEHYLAYHNDRTITFPYWDSTNSKMLLPIQIDKRADGVLTSESIAVKAGYSSISTTSSEPTGFSTEPGQGDYVSWTRYTNDTTNGRPTQVDRYHDIPSSGDGTLSTNFYRTVTQYDGEGQIEYSIQVVSGSSATDRKEQVTQNVYDPHGRVTKTKNYHGTETNDFTGSNFKWTYRGHLRGVEPFYINGSTETAIGPYTVNDVVGPGQYDVERSAS